MNHQILLAIGLLVATPYAYCCPTDLSVSLDATGLEISIVGLDSNKSTKICNLADKTSEAKLTHDKSAVILSGNRLIPTANLRTCGSQRLSAIQIAPSVGELVDANVSKGIYLALDLIGTSPMSFLATVGRFGSTQNLVDLPGAYVRSKSTVALRGQGFGYNPDYQEPRISPDGRYVSPSGSMDCSDTSYPGIWDITRNRRVIEKPGADGESDCKALFSPADRSGAF